MYFGQFQSLGHEYRIQPIAPLSPDSSGRSINRAIFSYFLLRWLTLSPKRGFIPGSIRQAVPRDRQNGKSFQSSSWVLPLSSIVSPEELVRLVVADNSLFLAIPLDTPAMLVREHSQQTQIGRVMDFLDIADWCIPRFYAAKHVLP